jgi:signal peptidase I
MKNFLSFILDVIKIVVIALVIVLPIRYFLFQPFLVSGSSMEPNFHDADYLIIDEISYRFRVPNRGEVIVFHYPLAPSERFIKRIIGLPGDTLTVQDNQIDIETSAGAKQVLNESSYFKIPPSLNDFSISLGANQYFVMGDNRNFSFDSRSWGPVPKENIIGRVWLKLWPFSQVNVIPLPNY